MWQSMETAPKDGTVILLWIEQPNQEPMVSSGWWGGIEYPHWCSHAAEGSAFSDQRLHWMPLPAGPNS